MYFEKPNFKKLLPIAFYYITFITILSAGGMYFASYLAQALGSLIGS